MDHIYDKLLHIPVDQIKNTYLRQKAVEGLQVMKEFCLDFGCTGTIDEDRIRKIRDVYIIPDGTFSEFSAPE